MRCRPLSLRTDRSFTAPSKIPSIILSPLESSSPTVSTPRMPARSSSTLRSKSNTRFDTNDKITVELSQTVKRSPSPSSPPSPSPSPSHQTVNQLPSSPRQSPISATTPKPSLLLQPSRLALDSLLEHLALPRRQCKSIMVASSVGWADRRLVLDRNNGVHLDRRLLQLRYRYRYERQLLLDQGEYFCRSLG